MVWEDVTEHMIKGAQQEVTLYAEDKHPCIGLQLIWFEASLPRCFLGLFLPLLGEQQQAVKKTEGRVSHSLAAVTPGVSELTLFGLGRLGSHCTCS